METKKTQLNSKSDVIQENIVNNSTFRQPQITHGTWNYSQNSENSIKDEIKIKHETLNFTM
tara:strand:+ start:916 stop:1098 length:183 start_codon:yes stop_codon:yes gene_type:complete